MPVHRTVALAVVSKSASPEIDVKEEVVSSTTVRLEVTVPAKMCKTAYKSLIDEWNNKIACTGYRKGKAPESVLIEQLGGKQRVYNTILSQLIETVMGPALEKAPSAATAIADSEKIEQTGEELEGRFDPNKDLTFGVLFDTLPRVKWSKPYKSLSITVTDISNDARNEEIFNKKLRQLQKEGSQLTVVTGRGIEKGDVVILDFDAYINGEQIPGAVRQGMQLDTDTADEDFLPGVSDAIAGMKAGEEKETKITFPTSEDFSPAALRGETADIKVKVSEVFEYDLPELTDDWAAKKMGPGSTLEDVKNRLKENTVAEHEDQFQQVIADAFTDAVAKIIDVEIPQSLIQDAGQNEYSRELNSLISKGTISYEQAQQLASPQMLQQYIKNKKDDLEHLQKAALGFADILASEGLTPSEQDIQDEFETAMEGVRKIQREEELNEEGVRDQVIQSLQTQLVMDWLVKNCEVNKLPFEG